MKRAHGFLFNFAMAFAVVLFPSLMDGEPSAFAQESGSAERQDRPFPLPFDPVPQESGSREKFDPQLPRPFDPFPAESGSQEKPGGVFPSDPSSPGGTKTPAAPAQHDPPGSSSAENRVLPTIVTTEFPNLIVPVVILLAGLFLVGWALFRMGLFNPYAATLWPKRLELCIEIALRIDDFMTAYREENFAKCQMSLDALNHLNGRRSIILSNEINATVNRFVEHAVNAKVSKDDEAFQKDFNRQYELVIESLRVGTRQEELTLEVLRSLTKAQGSHRRLRETPTEG